MWYQGWAWIRSGLNGDQGAGPSHMSQSSPGGTGCVGCGSHTAPDGLLILTCFS